MFWSKIWLFLVALAATAALTVALALPRSAHRSRVQDERQRLVVACGVVDILLEGKARDDVQVVENFSRDDGLVTALEKVKPDQELKATESPSRDVLQIVTGRMGAVEGHKPTLAVVTDAAGRVVARAGVDEGQVGDVVAGRFLIDDALAGYLRDDLWVEAGSLFLVAASPVVKRARDGDEIIGAAVLGWKLDNALADGFVDAFRDKGAAGDKGDKAAPRDAEDRSIQVAFFAADKQVAKSTTTATLDTPILAQFGQLSKPKELVDDCKQIAPFYAKDDSGQYAAVVSRLPGEAEHSNAFYAVFTPRPAEASFSGAVSKAKSELGGGFPWVIVGVLFFVGFGVGVVLMILEADRPLRRLQADAVRLAKGDKERLVEEDHGGRFGSIARSVNIQIDKLARDAKAAKKDLDQLLGPAPEGSLGALDLLGGSALPARPAAPVASLIPPAAAAPPPPSEFKFGEPTSKSRPSPAGPDLDLGTGPAAPARPAPPAVRAATPPPGVPAMPPPRPPVPGSRAPTPAPIPPPKATPPKRLEDDILSFGDDAATPEPAAVDVEPPAEDPYFREVYEQFLELKKKCGESTAGLTFAKFGDKLRKNRDELVSKTGCAQVKFTVYVKDGKAALKATPVKD